MNALSDPACNQQHRTDAARKQLARRSPVDLSSHALGRTRGRVQLGAGLGQGAVRDQNVSAVNLQRKKALG